MESNLPIFWDGPSPPKSFYMKRLIQDIQPNLSYYHVHVNLFPNLLTSENHQDFILNSKKIKILPLCYIIWQMKDKEKELFKNGSHNDSFFKKISKFISTEPEHTQQIFYGFCTMMLFEDPLVLSHWNFKNLLTKESLDTIIFESLNNDPIASFEFFLKHLSIYELINARKISPSNSKMNKLPLNITTYLFKKIINNSVRAQTKYKLLLNKVEKTLHLTTDIDALLSHIHLGGVTEFQLRNINLPLLTNKIVHHQIEDKMISCTLMEIAKYNSMTKALSNRMNNTQSYGLDGKNYLNFEELVYHFYSDPFLKIHMFDFMRAKSLKAIKSDNKALWIYYPILLGTKETQHQTTIIQRNKI